MIKIFWFTLWLATVIFFIAYVRTRDKIPLYKREKFERWIMFSLIILLLINISTLIFERRETSYEMNDCIRFYRYFPYFYNDSEFYFINEWCYKYFDDKEIQKLRESGIAWQKKQLEGSFNLNKLIPKGLNSSSK